MNILFVVMLLIKSQRTLFFPPNALDSLELNYKFHREILLGTLLSSMTC
jgi:hypothetical protein